jgi:hypothetical protein
MQALHVLVLVAGTLSLPACGGASSSGTPPVDGGGLDSATGDGGSPPPEAGPLCPSSVTYATGSCTGALVCEYGRDPDLRCDTVVTCSSGVWTQTQAPSGQNCQTASAPECPATFAALTAEAGACAPVDIACIYPEARCSCATHCGNVGIIGSDGGGVAEWCCLDAPQSSCPSPRPRLGDPCGTQGQICDYGYCSGNVALECDRGVWAQAPPSGCPG